jgi:hypothetical protein
MFEDSSGFEVFAESDLGSFFDSSIDLKASAYFSSLGVVKLTCLSSMVKSNSSTIVSLGGNSNSRFPFSSESLFLRIIHCFNTT